MGPRPPSLRPRRRGSTFLEPVLSDPTRRQKGRHEAHGTTEYETDEYYAVTAYATTLDDAARQATRYMIDYLEQVHGLDRTDAYVLASLAADLRIGAVVDVPHVLVAMHIPKSVLPGGR